MIKITPADSWFSKCVRERAEWKCERCGNQPNKQGLHCSHYHGRGQWGVRFEPLNAFANCMGCHLYFEARPHEFSEWVRNKIGNDNYELLNELRNDINRGKEYRRTKGKGEISKHYKDQFEIMQWARESGVTGRIEFVGWL